MKKVISMSLWGNNPHYVIGAILNADIAKEEWLDWTCRYYVSPNVPESAVKELASRDNTEVILMNEDVGWNGMFWRFYAAGDSEVDVMISRDTDSRISVRDKAAVDEWLSSDKDFHIMRDMCQHGWAVCGGMWGARNGILSNIVEMINNYSRKDHDNNHGIDQHFLTGIYSHLYHRAFIHDDWFPNKFMMEQKHPFPIPRLRGEGWWNTDFPDWHSGIEDDEEKYDWKNNGGHCFLKCPACKIWHDNDYIGKLRSVTKKEKEKYSHIIEDLD
jgi:hypothetical protein